MVLPTYNRESTLLRAVKSVLDQTYDDLELIIVDDCSTDGTEKLIKSVKDKRLKYVKLHKNSGANTARNYGIKKAKGDYIAFQDSDDEWLPEKLARQYQEVSKSSTDVCFCRFIKIGKNSEEAIPEEGFILPDTKKEVWRKTFSGNFVSTQTLLVKKDVLEHIKFDEKLPRFQDWDFLIRVAKDYKISFVDDPLVNVYVQNDSISKSNPKAIRALEKMSKKYAAIFEQNPREKYAFLKAKCKILWNIGEDPKDVAKSCLRYKFDVKVFAILLLSSLGVRKYRG